MKNRYMPAMPIGEHQLTEAVAVKGCPPEMKAIKYVKAFGLTKREHFAGLAMQGFISNSIALGEASRDNPHDAFDVVAMMSIKAADALLEALEKDNEL